MLHWSIQFEATNTGPLSTEDPRDRLTLSEHGIEFTNDVTSTISIPIDTVDNNNTLIHCVANLYGGNEFSELVKLTILGN